jgi:hypothetical protein
MLDGWQPYLRALWIVDCCAVRSGSHGHCFTSKHTHTVARTGRWIRSWRRLQPRHVATVHDSARELTQLLV